MFQVGPGGVGGVMEDVNSIINTLFFRVYLGVKTCEVFLCFLAFIFLGSIVLTS